MQAIQEVLDTVPGAIAQFARLADGIRQTGNVGRKAYRATHWGQDGGGRAAVGSIPNPAGGVIELGRLVEITYLTKKGRDRRPIAYQHRFGEGAEDPTRGDPGAWGDPKSCPILSFTYDETPSGLVIVRADSDYTVTDHGIEG